MSTTSPLVRARVPRLAEAALERARLSVVPKRRRRNANPVPFLVVISMLAVGGIVGLLLFNTSMQQASFAATDLQQQADLLEARQQSLQMQLDQLRDPQTIALKAQRMGMVLPTSPAILDLRTGKVSGSPTPATRLDPLHLLAPAPPKPLVLDSTSSSATTGTGHATAQGGKHDTSGNTGRGSHGRTGTPGRNGQNHNGHRNHSQHAGH